MHHENAFGVPIPSPEVEARVRDIEPTMKLRAYRLGEEADRTPRIQWAAVMDWPEHDPKRARVQSGELDPAMAFDIVAFLPLDISPAEIPGYLERGLTTMYAGGQRGYVGEMLDRIRAANAKTNEERWYGVIDSAMELFDTHASLASPDVIRVGGVDVPGMGPTVSTVSVV